MEKSELQDIAEKSFDEASQCFLNALDTNLKRSRRIVFFINYFVCILHSIAASLLNSNVKEQVTVNIQTKPVKDGTHQGSYL